jgi:hypothetical protein
MDFNIISSASQFKNLPTSGVPLINTSVRGFSPAKLISFIDLTTSVLENNPEYNVYETILPKTNTVEYMLPEKYKGYGSGVLLVTDRTTESQLVDFTLPLYHQYQLMYDYYLMDPALPNGFITIRKNMESVVSYDNYVLETREYLTASGRYNTDATSGFLWSTSPRGTNIVTARLLLPIREKDNFYTVEYNKYKNGTVTEYHNELIYEQKLYNEGHDYTITPSSIVLTSNSLIASGSPLFIQRDLDSFISIKPPVFTQDDVKEKPWNMQISCGSFVHSSGILGGVRSYIVSNNFYSSDGNISYGQTEMEIPKIINKNILKVSVVPMFDAGSGYPDYNISDTIISGSINGKSISSQVTSIDFNNGYIYLKQDIKPTDSVFLTYAYNDKKTILVNSIDLNPRNTEDALVDVAVSPLGIAIVPSGTTFYNSASTPSSTSNWSHIVYYNLSDNVSGNFDSSSTIGYALECVSDSIIDGPISGIIPSGSKMMGFFTLNSISNNMIQRMDIRRTGGYNPSGVIVTSGWRGFSDIGYWDGEAFPQAGTILIQIPKVVFSNIIDIFTRDFYVQETSKYNESLTKLIEPDSHRFESTDQQIDRAAKKYIRDTIERYLPVGCLYIIVDEEFKPWPSIRSES